MEIPSLWPAVTGEWARTYNPGTRQITPNLVRVWLPRQIPSSAFVNALEMAFVRRLWPSAGLTKYNVTKCVSAVVAPEQAVDESAHRLKRPQHRSRLLAEHREGPGESKHHRHRDGGQCCRGRQAG